MKVGFFFCIIGCYMLIAVTQPAGGQVKSQSPPAPVSTTTETASPLSFSLTLALTVPFGDGAELYNEGGAGTVGVIWPMPFAKFIALGAELGYGIQPVVLVQQYLSSISAGLSFHGVFSLGPWFQFMPFVSGGYFLAFETNGGMGRSIYASGGAQLAFQFSRNWAVTLEGSYDYLIGLEGGFHIGLGTVWTPVGVADYQPLGRQIQSKSAPVLLNAGSGQPARGRAVEITGTELNPAFAVFYKYYDDHPLGKVTIRNIQKAALEKVSVSFLVNQYMDNPKVCASCASLAPGAEFHADLFALFNDKMMDITEATKLSAKVTVDYETGGTPMSEEFTDTLPVYDRNASTWEDNRRAAAFVTTKDPSVLSFSKNVMAAIQNRTKTLVNKNLVTAMAIHQSLSLYGLSYVSDPNSGFSAAQKNKSGVDYLQFPRQTLQYKAGDCDDLSILYCALLESIGVETAFITIPGHIFMAFSLGVSADQASKDFPDAADMIMKENKAWIPIEVTDRRGDFLDAWQVGIKEWRSSDVRKEAGFYPVHDAWSMFEPVGFTGEVVVISLPDSNQMVSSYANELTNYIDMILSPQIVTLQGEISKSRSPADPLTESCII
jgi:hypothetical protein